MRRRGLLVAAALILVTNAVVLVEVARNRAGAPVETIQLTERELPLNFRGKEDTGVSVSLNGRRFYSVGDDFSWLNQAKLEELGFDYARALRHPQDPPCLVRHTSLSSMRVPRGNNGLGQRSSPALLGGCPSGVD